MWEVFLLHPVLISDSAWKKKDKLNIKSKISIICMYIYIHIHVLYNTIFAFTVNQFLTSELETLPTL